MPTVNACLDLLGPAGEAYVGDVEAYQREGLDLRSAVKAALIDARAELQGLRENLMAQGVEQVVEEQPGQPVAWQNLYPEERAVIDELQRRMPVLESRVWHSGPQPWLPEPGFPYGRPRLDFVQSGEGGQMFGWGFYSAENEAVSGPEGVYARSFSQRAPITYKGQILPSNAAYGLQARQGWSADQIAATALYWSKGGAVGFLEDEVLKLTNRIERDLLRENETIESATEARDKLQEAIRLIRTRKIKESDVTEGKAATYHLEIPDADVARMILWDKPLSEQTEEVQTVLEQIKPQEFTTATPAAIVHLRQVLVGGKGMDLYEALGRLLPHVPNEHPKKKVSEYLRSLGIVGNKYLDQGSRYDSEEGTLLDKNKRKVQLPYASDPLSEESVAQASALSSLQVAEGDYKKARDHLESWRENNFAYTRAIELLNSWEEAGYTYGKLPLTYNFVIWDQDVLDRIAQLNPKTGMRLFTQARAKELADIAAELDAPKSALERVSGALAKSEKLYSMLEPGGLWFSPLAEAAKSATQNKMQPAQWLGWLKKQQGVKQEEIEDTGLEDWLDAQPVGVTKEAVVDFLDRGGVKVEEKVLGGSDVDTSWTREERLDDINTEQLDLNNQFGFRARMDGSPYGLYDVVLENGNFVLADTGEVLELSPEDAEMARQSEALRQEALGLRAELDRPRQGVSETQYGSYQAPGGKNYRELLITVPAQVSAEDRSPLFQDADGLFKIRKADGSLVNGSWKNIEAAVEALRDLRDQYPGQFRDEEAPIYTSSHWPEPNVLVHIRFNERADAEGARVLFVEEVQSDWHQEGRKKGYQKPSQLRPKDEWVAEYNQVKKDIQDLTRAEVGYSIDTLAPNLDSNFEKYSSTLVPREVERLAKLRDAAWRLFDEQTQRNAEEQAVPNAPFKASWPMLGMKRAIRWAAENGFDKVAWPKGAEMLQYPGGWSGPPTLQNGEWITPEGKNVTGLVNMYNKGLPQHLLKFGKKYGTKVGTTIIEVPPTGWREEQPTPREVWSFPITPKLKAQAERGMPLYSRPPILEPEYWFTDPTSQAIDIAYGQGRGDKFIYDVLDMFHPFKKKAPGLYDLFDLAKTKKSAWTTRYREKYHKPLEKLVVDYSKKWKNRGENRDREWVDDHLAATHIVVDDVNMTLARDSANVYAGKLITALANSTAQIPSPTTGRQRLVRELLKEQRANVLAGLTMEGRDAHGNLVTNRNAQGIVHLSTAQTKQEMLDLVDFYMEFEPLAGTKQKLRIDWESLKNHGGGMQTGIRPTRWANQRSAQLEIAAQNEVRQAAATGAAVGQLPDANALYADIQNDSDFDEIRRLINTIARDKLDTLSEYGDSGLITPAEYARLTNSKQFYVPLKRSGFAYEFADELNALLMGKRTGGGKQLGGTRAGSTEVMGRKPVMIMQNLLASLDAARAAAERNAVLNEMYDLEQAGGLEGWFTVVDKNEYVGRDKRGFIKETSSTQWEPSDIHFIRKGKHLVLRPNMENQKAVQISRAINNLDAQEVSGWLKSFQHVNNWVRNVNVAFSPLFLLTNSIKDPLTAAYNLKASEAAPFVKSIFGEYKNSLRALYRVHMKGLNDPNDPDYQLVRAFEDAGGRTSFVLSLQEMDDTSRSFNGQVRRAMGNISIPSLGIEVLSPKAGKFYQVARNGLEFIENMNIIMENVMRLSAYTVLTKPTAHGGAGLPSVRAARIAKDMTTNFSRRGNKTQALSAWWLFFNAAAQGNYQVWRNLTSESNRKVLQKMVLGTVAFSFMLDQLGRLMADDEDNDGINDWDAIPEWEKEKYIHLPFAIPGTGGHYAKIPAPWIFNVFWRTGQMLGEATSGRRSIGELAADVPALAVNTFNPLGSPPTLLQAIAPTALDPLVQIAENRGPFGTPIGPEQYPGAGKKPLSELSFSSTPEGYRDVSRFLNQISGGSLAESGKIDVRPGDVQLLTEFAMGSLGRFISDFGGLATGKAEKITDVPLLRPLVTAPSSSVNTELYYERTAEVFAAKKLEKLYSEGEHKDLQQLREHRRENRQLLNLGGAANDVERQIRDLREQLRLARARDQEGRIELLENRIDEARKRFNQLYARRVGM